MDRCCWNCKKIKIEETAQAKLAKAFQAKLKKVGVMHRGNDIQMSCPVTGGVMIPASEAILLRVYEGCQALSCFEPKEEP